MPQHIMRIAVSGPIDNVKDSVVSCISQIGFNILSIDIVSNAVGEDGGDDSDSFNHTVRAQITGILRATNDSKNQIHNSEIHAAIDLSMLSENKTILRIKVYLNSSRQFRLTQNCLFIVNKIVRDISAEWPTIELKMIPVQLPKFQDDSFFQNQNVLRTALIVMFLCFSILITTLLDFPRHFSDESRLGNIRDADKIKQNLALNHDSKLVSEDRSDPPSSEFVLISVSVLSDNLKSCQLRVDLHKPYKIQIINIKMIMLIIDKSNWLINSKAVDFQIPKDNQLGRHSRWIKLQQGVCENIDRIAIEEVQNCVILDQTSTVCRSILKSDPKSSIPVKI